MADINNRLRHLKSKMKKQLAAGDFAVGAALHNEGMKRAQEMLEWFEPDTKHRYTPREVGE